MWGLGEVYPQNSHDSGPAVCSGTHEDEDATPSQHASGAQHRHATGAQLCKALNRPDLPTLLGTPEDSAQTAEGSESVITLADGAKTATPEANVTLETYSVKLSASNDRLPVGQAVDYLGSAAETRTVLGHPAVLYSDRTISITFDGGKADTGPGGIARCLLVARDAKDGGGSFEVVIWRQDDVPPDDAALFRVAEQVLPTIPGWTAT